jgi:hypothetical protein
MTVVVRECAACCSGHGIDYLRSENDVISMINRPGTGSECEALSCRRNINESNRARFTYYLLLFPPTIKILKLTSRHMP